MRVIAGEGKRRRLKVPSAVGVRPTSSRVRVVLFDMLEASIFGVRFLDICAGSGAVGIEALSRGARAVTFIERNRHCVRCLWANLECMGLKRKARVIVGDALKTLGRLSAAKERFDLIFADPPYGSRLAEQILFWIGNHPHIAAEHGWVIVQHFFKENLPENPGSLLLSKERQVGETVLSFYRRER